MTSASNGAGAPASLLPLTVNPQTPNVIITSGGDRISVAWADHPSENPYARAEEAAAYIVKAVNGYAASPLVGVEAGEEGRARLPLPAASGAASGWMPKTGALPEAVDVLRRLADWLTAEQNESPSLSQEDALRSLNGDTVADLADTLNEEALGLESQRNEALRQLAQIEAQVPNDRRGEPLDVSVSDAFSAQASLNAFEDQLGILTAKYSEIYSSLSDEQRLSARLNSALTRIAARRSEVFGSGTMSAHEAFGIADAALAPSLPGKEEGR